MYWNLCKILINLNTFIKIIEIYEKYIKIVKANWEKLPPISYTLPPISYTKFNFTPQFIHQLSRITPHFIHQKTNFIHQLLPAN